MLRVAACRSPSRSQLIAIVVCLLVLEFFSFTVAQAQDAQFYRYIALSNRFTAGVCADTALDQDRQALVKMWIAERLGRAE